MSKQMEWVGRTLKTQRLFFSLWPPDELRHQIVHRTRTLTGCIGGRVIPSANLHVTVLFVGAVLESRTAAVMAAAEAVRASAFSLQLDEIQTWPGSNVLCLTTLHHPPELSALADQLLFKLRAQQFKLNRQDYRPHITLVRDIARFMDAKAIEPLTWQVSEFVLIDSTLTSQGSLYTVIGRWPLQMATRCKT